jgi:transposase
MRTKQHCCGLDVHKDTIFAAIYVDKAKNEIKEFSTFTPDIVALSQWLKDQGVTKVAMESTGIYWIPIWNILEKEGFKLLLVNPYFIKQMPGRKSDVKDSQWIAQLLAKGMLRGSLIPEEHIRELRLYSREYVRKKAYITRCMQSMERILETAGIHITSLVSKIESKTVLDTIDQLVKGQTHAEKLIHYVHGRIINSKKRERVLQSLQGFIKPEHRMLLRQKQEEYQLLCKQVGELEQQMTSICNTHYKKELELLKTMPGVDTQAAMQIIAETGANMNPFDSSKKLTGWAGLRPRNDESAGKIKSKATTKGNKYLKRIMVQTAWAASRTKASSYYIKFTQLAMRKGNKKALIAIARKQLSVVWNILGKQQPYIAQLQPVYNAEQLQNKKAYYEKQLEQLNRFC